MYCYLYTHLRDYNTLSHMLHVWNKFTYIYHTFKPNVGKYSIHGYYGYYLGEYI